MIESTHSEAARLGIEQPQLEHYEYIDHDGVRNIALTPESEKIWSDYLRAITLAKMAMLK